MSPIKKPLLRSENEKMNNSQISIVHIRNPKKNPYFRIYIYIYIVASYCNAKVCYEKSDVTR